MNRTHLGIWGVRLALGLGIALGASAARSQAEGADAPGVVRVASQRSVPETVEALEGAIEARGLRLFASVDHAANAQGAGLELEDTVLLLFGNPRVGTPLMRAARTVALDLPQKMLVWSEGEGEVWIAYNDPRYLGERHGLAEQSASLERIAGLLAALAREAGTP